jgi:hypothetical protein
MKQKLLLSALLCSSAFALWGQNGTRPDEAKVILGSEVIRAIFVLANDNAVAGKTYQLASVYKTSTKNFIINVSGQNVNYQDKDHGQQNDTFFYVAREISSGSLDTNYVVIKKDVLPRDLYPGDANKDNICNNIDVLSIGIAYGSSEIPREGIYNTDNWVPVSSYNWALTNIKSNYRFSDANGDGTIDSLGDISTIMKNYNEDNVFPNVHYSPSGGEGFLIIAPDSVKFNASTGNFSVKINLGNSSKPIDKAYGVAFTIKYNPLHIKSSNINFKTSSWFRDNAKTLNFSRVNGNDGEVDIAIVRKTGIGGTGVGELGVIDVVIEDVLGGITDGINTNFEITKPVLIDSVYNILPVTIPNPKPIHVIKKISSQINTNQRSFGLRYFINNQTLTLKNENTKPLEVSIVNILGKEISKKVLAPNQTIETDTNIWSSGIYFLKTNSEVYKIHLK